MIAVDDQNSRKNSKISSNPWLEATIAWTVCASVHEKFAKNKDPLWTISQADYKHHADECRAMVISSQTRAIDSDVSREIKNNFAIEGHIDRYSQQLRQSTSPDETHVLVVGLAQGAIDFALKSSDSENKRLMVENKVNLLEEDIACLHQHLDDQGVPRKNGDQTYSMWGRVLQLIKMKGATL